MDETGSQSGCPSLRAPSTDSIDLDYVQLQFTDQALGCVGLGQGLFPIASVDFKENEVYGMIGNHLPA